jgi:hypothetical protein
VTEAQPIDALGPVDFVVVEFPDGTPAPGGGSSAFSLSPTTASLIAQLKGLREAGALTDAELKAKKAQILGL